jgi:hypothetical protein
MAAAAIENERLSTPNCFMQQAVVKVCACAQVQSSFLRQGMARDAHALDPRHHLEL